ncbi:DUF1045 domain-containing protein [Roseobacter sp. HKCCA0434]|uniref:DUF1045 domain-containing protein n=1 Tax=Roseobacter sp. HKCCA0434 TaxID=3079297 RepID=UPI002905988C|nr:DUF1045 domain-containing protein [Roseobacter sp. HKCCA0434]
MIAAAIRRSRGRAVAFLDRGDPATLSGDGTAPAVSEDWIATPRKGGFHATLKSPFHFASGMTPCTRRGRTSSHEPPPRRRKGLETTQLGRFVAFRPVGRSDLGRVAATCVTELDDLRAPASQADLARHRPAGLSDRQEALLTRGAIPTFSTSSIFTCP